MTRSRRLTSAPRGALFETAQTALTTRSADALFIRTFGILRFEDRGGRELRAPTRKTAALAAYLAMRPGKRVARDVIASLLWGDKEDACARHSLSQAVSDVRHAFGEHLICVDSQFLWSPCEAAEVDALRLADLLSRQSAKEDLEAVERLYDGEFLQGVDLSQEDFDCWVLAERERLRH